MKETSKPYDVFAQMGREAILSGSSSLVEPEPPTEDQVPWLLPTIGQVPLLESPTLDQDLESFQQGLTDLRRQYRPFLDDYSPPPEMTRPKRAIEQWSFRYHQTDDGGHFAEVLEGQGDWERVTLPDFRGPSGGDGRWTGYYRSQFDFHRAPDRRVHLIFDGVDYRCQVYLNQRCLGSHEGFFGAFSFDVTDWILEHNTLLVEIENDFPMMGVDGTRLDGDKIYAATGPGWNDPEVGWHHCPPGAGIYQSVWIEERAEVYVDEMFLRPNLDESALEALVEVAFSGNQVIHGVSLILSVFALNFVDGVNSSTQVECPYLGPGRNDIRVRISIPDARRWNPDTPYLYGVRVQVKWAERLVDEKTEHFGMRKFHMDETALPKGTLYLNNQPIILRGSNEMGHLQQCLMQGKIDQLVDDILIAKYAHLNFLRTTQRPLQREIYDYFDRLGMLNQCDLPLFGVVRRPQVSEVLRQTVEMERLVRNHPSTIMISFINEATSVVKHQKGHRHLFRHELRQLLLAARQLVLMENPDRVIKDIEGDYEPPADQGLSDFHLYTLWYTNHMIEFGRFHRGFLPAIQHGWRASCGEYGAEGLDYRDTMEKYYPERWLPQHSKERWWPTRIPRSQTYGLHGDWFQEPEDIDDWIERSQAHQALATRLVTDGLRRRADLVVSTAVHLLIDAWPSGWMKALVGVDRRPKPAYFALRRSLTPIRVHLRSDQWKAYSQDWVPVEVWLLNDSRAGLRNCRIRVSVRMGDVAQASYEAVLVQFPVASSAMVGRLAVQVPEVSERSLIHVDSALLSETGQVLNAERFIVQAFPKRRLALPSTHYRLRFLGARAQQLLSDLNRASTVLPSFEPWDGMPFDRLVADSEAIARVRSQVEPIVKSGASLLELAGESPIGPEPDESESACQKTLGGVYFLAFDGRDSRLQAYHSDDFSFMYNHRKRRIDFSTTRYTSDPRLRPLLWTYEPVWRLTGKEVGKTKRTVLGTMAYGQGEWIVSMLTTEGLAGWNPPLDALLVKILTGEK